MARGIWPGSRSPSIQGSRPIGEPREIRGCHRFRLVGLENVAPPTSAGPLRPASGGCRRHGLCLWRRRHPAGRGDAQCGQAREAEARHRLRRLQGHLHSGTRNSRSTSPRKPASRATIEAALAKVPRLTPPGAKAEPAIERIEGRDKGSYLVTVPDGTQPTSSPKAWKTGTCRPRCQTTGIASWCPSRTGRRSPDPSRCA